MNAEYKEFVELHGISQKLAKEVFDSESIECKACYGAFATPFVINRNALFQLRIATGIKH